MRSLCRLSLSVFLLLFFFNVPHGLAQDDHDHSEEKSQPRKQDLRRSSAQREGLRENPPRKVAIVGATVHRTPTSEAKIETILIDGSKIVAIGNDLVLPPGTKTIDGTGKHCYAGFIDAYVGQDIELSAAKGTGYWNDKVRPQLSVAQELDVNALKLKDLRSAGFTSALFAPSHGIIKGQSSLVLLSDYETEHLFLATDVAQHIQ